MPNLPADKCPLLEHDAQVSAHPTQTLIVIKCPGCGPYQITHSLAASFNQLSREERLGAAYYSRHCKEAGLPPPTFSSDGSENQITTMKDKWHPLPVAEKARLLLLEFARRTASPGEEVVFLPLANHIPLIRASSEKEVRYFLSYLISMGLIEEVDRERVRVTYQGWLRVEQHFTTRNAFVAMWFNPEMDEPYRIAISSAIEQAGYSSICMKDVLHNDKICDRIEVEIRNSAFLIADFTGQRGGVYFEAGFARGLGKPVIWLCRRDQEKDIHFDTRQYNHIFWDDLEVLRLDLKSRIDATITPSIEAARNRNRLAS